MGELTLTNGPGHRVVLRTLGAAIGGIFVPDRSGHVACVTVDAGGSAGKTIGRYANRIARGELPLGDKTYRLGANEGLNTLHGGPDGFSKREWEVANHGGSAAEFSLQSPDGDQGFPGTMTCTVRYTWLDDDALRIDYTATSDKDTVVNLTNHVYFNLSNEAGRSVADNRLRIPASAYTPLDDELIPTGEIASVQGTTRDFRATREIGDEKYDCNYVLDGWDGTLRLGAELFDPQAGRKLSVETTQPGMQLYTGKPGAIALETQHFADAPHHSNFPSTLLRAGDTFRSTTIYRFG
ncbi:MAG: galactose mutarotase [Candidatus Eremiobacteraeota bacterium]|nr:galactose mutarotase [Candidatus Eremiobacteraeota bacterium]